MAVGTHETTTVRGDDDLLHRAAVDSSLGVFLTYCSRYMGASSAFFITPRVIFTALS